MNRQKSREIVENVLSGIKAGFKAILNFEHAIERKKMENQKSKSTFSTILLTLTLMVAAFWVSSAVGAEKKMVIDPTTSKMVTAPTYGGTFIAGYANQPRGTDPSVANHWAGFLLSGVNEKLAMGDWGIERDVYGYRTELVPDIAFAGALAERWFTPDPTTIIFHIRKGVHWHDKAPMSGRELTADDIVFNYHRLMGLGSGFTEPPGFTMELPTVPVESITATDKYTVVFKLKTPSLTAFRTIVDDGLAYMLPPEVIKEHGDVNDWRKVVGTGPFMLTDWVDASSITWVKNPNYWGFDEKYPENRLPYFDEIEGLIIMEETTRLAAMRTGKVDFLGHGALWDMPLATATKLQETNPEIDLWPFAYRSDQTWAFNVTQPPFNDIRVRTAMQMAMDLEEINEVFFNGKGDWKPRGMIGPWWDGYFVPFEEWPQELQAEYTYNPQRAEELLDEAGYPRGADGIRIRTSLEAFEREREWVELSINYWSEIGVEVDFNVVDVPTFIAHVRNKGYGGMTRHLAGAATYPLGNIVIFETGHDWNRQGVDDPVYNAIVEAAKAATSTEELKKQISKADMYGIERHWYTWGPMVPYYHATQPWVVGFNGEVTLGGMNYGGIVWARLWIDQELKKEMGY